MIKCKSLFKEKIQRMPLIKTVIPFQEHMQGNEKITKQFSSLKRSGIYAALTRNKKSVFQM